MPSRSFVCFSQVSDAIFVFTVTLREFRSHDVCPGSSVKAARGTIRHGLPEIELVQNASPLAGPDRPSSEPLSASGTKAPKCGILPLISEECHEAA